MAPDPDGEAYSAPPDLLAVLKEPTSKGRREEKEMGKGRREEKRKEREGEKGREGGQGPINSVKPKARKVGSSVPAELSA